jgi:two-component system, sensor histidine kinase LadS
MRIFQFFSFFVLLVMAQMAQSASCTGVLLENNETLNTDTLAPGLRQVAAEYQPLTLNDVTALPPEAFKAVPGDRLHVDYGRTLWLRLCLRRHPNSPPHWGLFVLPAYLNSVTLYEHTRDGIREQTHAPSRNTLGNDISYRGAAFLLSPVADSTSEYYLAIEGRRGAVNLTVMEQNAIPGFIAMEYGGFGLYLGMLFLVAVLNLSFWHRLRDPLYLRYALALFSIAGFASLVDGYIMQIFPGLFGFYRPALILLYATSASLLISFVLQAFRTRLYYPRLYRIGYLLIISLGFIGAVGAILDPQYIDPMRLIRWHTLAAIIIFPLMILHALFHHRGVRLYAIAFLPLALSFIVITANNMEMLPGNALFNHLPNIATIIHLILLNWALARRAERSERHRHRALRAALEASRGAERVLESRVLERTRELKESNNKLHREAIERSQAQHRLQESLEREQRALYDQRQYTAMLAHEIRNPLAVISTASDSLRRETPESNDTAQQRLARIQRNTRQIIDLLDNLLARDRLHSPLKLNLRHCDLVDLLFDRYPPGDNKRIHLDLPSLPVPALVDPEMIAVAIHNLVTNALKYSPPDTPVIVRLSETTNGLELRVEDQGPGISEQEKTKIFERYYRAPNETKAAGSGLGLHICREIIVRHGGRIGFRAQEYGNGTIAWIRLPRNVEKQ